MSIKLRRQKSHSPEPTFKEKGGGIVYVWQSHIFYTNIFKVKKMYSKKVGELKLKA